MKNMLILKKIVKFVGSMIAVFFCLFFTDSTVHAARYVDMNPNDTTWDAYIDEENYICIDTYDLKRSSTIIL